MKNFLLVFGFLVLGLGSGFFIAPYARAYLQGKPQLESGNFSGYFKQGGPHVVLFSTSTCPYCKRTREFLASRNIAFDDYVIDTSDEAGAKFKALNEPGVPVVLTEHRKLVGFNPAGLETLTASAN